MREGPEQSSSAPEQVEPERAELERGQSERGQSERGQAKRSRPERGQPERKCIECGAPAPQRFCGSCGAEQHASVAPSLAHFTREAVREVTEVDSALLSSFRALLTRPGELTRAYLHGPRHRYLRPLRVFFIANVIYFFVAGLSPVRTFATPLDLQVRMWPGAELKATMVASTLRHLHTDVAGLAPRWDAITEAHARTLIVLMIPLYALVFALLLVWSGRPAVQHTVFAIHFMTFYLVFLSAVALALWAIPPAFWQGVFRGHGDRDISIAGLAALSLYTYLAVRRAYGLGRFPALTVMVGATLLALPVLAIYRFALFFTVWAVVR